MTAWLAHKSNMFEVCVDCCDSVVLVKSPQVRFKSVMRRNDMPEFSAHVLVCNAVTGDNNHCGDKGGFEVREKFNQLLADHGLIGKVNVSNTGCTSQHRFCEKSQCSIIVYGPGKEGTWYIVDPDNVEEIVEENLINGNKVKSLVNNRLSTRLG